MNDNQWAPTTTASEHASGHEDTHSAHEDNGTQEHEGYGDHEGHHDHHAHMVADFRRRFGISLILTILILVLSPLIQSILKP